MPKVYDCFTFFNELDLLEIRLNELDGLVDRFVLCESPYTFRGDPKPLHFRANRDRFARFLPKIEHVVVEDMPLGGRRTEHDFFRKEYFQRNALRRGLASAAPRDFVILCDVDEIPRATAIEAIVRDDGPSQVHVLEMGYYEFFLNLRLRRGWDKPRLARFGDVRRLQALRSGGPQWRPNAFGVLPVLRQWKRMTFGVRPRPWTRVPDAGWHFRSMNGPAAIRDKFTAFSHVRPQMENEATITRNVARLLAEAALDDTATIEPLGEMPAFVIANRERFAAFLVGPETLALYGITAPARDEKVAI